MGLAFLASIWSAACSASSGFFPPPTYSAKEIQATVVEEATGRPIEGVVIVAQWVLRRESGDGPRLHVAEAVTDATGRFLIPGWGPKPRVALMALQDKSPQLLLFKHGYAPLILRNESRPAFIKSYPNYRSMTARQISERMTSEGNPNEPIQESFWNGMSIQLEPFQGTQERWLQLLEMHAWYVTRADLPQGRRFLEAIRAEQTYFELRKLDPSKRGSFDSLFSRVEELLK
jgi:hypothetical protein